MAWNGGLDTARGTQTTRKQILKLRRTTVVASFWLLLRFMLRPFATQRLAQEGGHLKRGSPPCNVFPATLGGVHFHEVVSP